MNASMYVPGVVLKVVPLLLPNVELPLILGLPLNVVPLMPLVPLPAVPISLPLKAFPNVVPPLLMLLVPDKIPLLRPVVDPMLLPPPLNIVPLLVPLNGVPRLVPLPLNTVPLLLPLNGVPKLLPLPLKTVPLLLPLKGVPNTVPLLLAVVPPPPKIVPLFVKDGLLGLVDPLSGVPSVRLPVFPKGSLRLESHCSS